MEMNVLDDEKLVEIWLTKAEKRNAALRERLKPIYTAYKAKKYLVVVYESGEGDLYELTRDLVLTNRWQSAEREVQRAKAQCSAAEH